MQWKTEVRDISSLYENPKNPRYISRESNRQLKKSLDKFGQCEPIVVQPNGQIIGGHQRVRTLKNMGVSSVTVSVPADPLPQKDADELTLRLNKNVGDWDYDILANEWEENILLESGFSDEELGLDSPSKNVEEKPKKLTITVHGETVTKLEEVEMQIQELLMRYNVLYKTKIK